MKILFVVMSSFFFLLDLSVAQQVLVWGVSSDLTPLAKEVKKFQEKISKKTNGRVRVVIKRYNENKIPGYFQGKFRPIRDDIYDIHQQGVDKYHSTHPSLKFWEIPFLFINRAHAESYIESSNASKLLTSIEDKNHLHVGYTYAGGFLFFMTGKSINSLLDLSGMTCGLDGGGGQEFFLYFLLPNGVFQTKNSVRGKKCNEVLSSDLGNIFLDLERGTYAHISLSRHRILPRVLSVSKKSLQRLQPKDRKTLLAELKIIAKQERLSVYKGVDDLKKILALRGINYNEWSLSSKIKERQRLAFLRKKYESILSKKALSEINYINRLTPNLNITPK